MYIYILPGHKIDIPLFMIAWVNLSDTMLNDMQDT